MCNVHGSPVTFLRGVPSSFFLSFKSHAHLEHKLRSKLHRLSLNAAAGLSRATPPYQIGSCYLVSSICPGWPYARAQVLDRVDQFTIVRLKDCHGFIEVVNDEDVFELDAELSSYPQVVLHCRLRGCDATETSSDEAARRFRNELRSCPDLRIVSMSSVMRQQAHEPLCEVELNVFQENTEEQDVLADDYGSVWNSLNYRSTNADMVASGFQAATDEDMVCRYSRFRGSCPRGDRCPRLHVDRHQAVEKTAPPAIFPTVDLSLDDLQFLAKVTEILSPSCFFMVRSSDLDEEVHSVYSSQTVMGNHDFQTAPAMYDQVAVLDPRSGKWSRARITGVSERFLYQVHLLDQGYKCVVPIQQMRRLKPRLLRFPAKALHCSLFNVHPARPHSTWQPEANSTFTQLIHRAGALLQVIIREQNEEGGFQVTLVSPSGTDVGQQLVDLGLAEFGNPAA